MMRRFLVIVPSALAFALAACAPIADEDHAETSEHAAITDIAKMTARGDGTFDVECTDGKKEIVSADDVANGRVCKPAAPPASPFAAGSCSGTPMTEAGALARLGGSDGPVAIGSYVLALRHRTRHYRWEPQRGYVESHTTWDDAPDDELVALRETGVASSSGVKAALGSKGTVVVAKDSAGKPFLRLVGEAVNVVGPDTTRFLRIVSSPLRPWAVSAGPTFELETSSGDVPSWSRLTEWGWSVTTRSVLPGGMRRSWWFHGEEIIVTERCGQMISSQTLSGLSPISAAIGIWLTLD